MIEKNKKKYFMEMVTFAILARIWDGDVFRGAIKNAGSIGFFLYSSHMCITRWALKIKNLFWYVCSSFPVSFVKS